MQIAVDHSVRRSTQNGVVSCSRRISGFRQANTASRGDRQSHTHFSDGDTSIPYGLQRRWILQSNVALLTCSVSAQSLGDLRRLESRASGMVALLGLFASADLPDRHHAMN